MIIGIDIDDTLTQTTELVRLIARSEYPNFKGKGITCIDIGTGSGCIAISIAKFNQKAYVTAMDISKNALEIAKKNAISNEVSDRVSFCEADIFNYEPYGKFDLVVSNPPYIKSKDILDLQKDVKILNSSLISF